MQKYHICLMARASCKVGDRRWPNTVKSKVCLRKYKHMIHSSGSIGENERDKEIRQLGEEISDGDDITIAFVFTPEIRGPATSGWIVRWIWKYFDTPHHWKFIWHTPIWNISLIISKLILHFFYATIDINQRFILWINPFPRMLL